MNLIIICIVHFSLNVLVLYLFQEKNISKKTFKYFTLFKSKYVLPKLLGFRSIKTRKYNDRKRLQDLNLEKIQLKNKLKMLEFVIDFEMYLSENNIDKSRFSQMKEFKNLKSSTQESILASTKKILNMKTPQTL